MKNLIPHFIHQQLALDKRAGSLTAFALFVDLSGFTKLTETLLKEGKAGAERLSNILDAIFEPMVHLVYAQGGFIPHFAGDAYFGIFPSETAGLNAEQVLAVARQHFVLLEKASASFPGFDIKIKVGISYGEVQWGIVGKRKKSFYFRGQAIEGCSESQAQAASQEIIADQYFKEQLADQSELERLAGPKYFRIKKRAKEGRPEDLLAPKKDLSLPDLSRKTLSQFLPRSVVQFNQKGEFRTVVSVFLSFQGLGSHEKLNEFSGIVLEQADNFSGYFKEMEFADKGGVMVIIFGAPLSFENNTERALQFLLAVVEESAGLQKSGLQYRAGAASGIAYTGIVGGKERCQYAAVGNRVNISARLMMKAGWGEILVDAEVQKNPQFRFGHKGDIAYKGLAKAIPTFRLEGRNVEYRQTFSGTMVGRASEMDQLVDMANVSFEIGTPAIAYVYGEAGIGKTRLAYELQCRLRKEKHLRWMTCQSDQILQKPFNPFIYFLKIYFGQSSDNSQSTNFDNFERHFAALVEDIIYAKHEQAERIKREVIRTKPVMAALTGLKTTNSLWENLDARGRYENTLAALSSLFKAEALRQPVVIELEDGHWFDQSSKEFLNEFIGQVKRFPIFLLVTSRYDDEGDKPRLFHKKRLEKHGLMVAEIDLNILDADGLREFAKEQLGCGIDKALHEILLKATNGNPFYAEQILGYFQESGQLLNIGNCWSVKDKSIQIADSIQPILTARIDRLSAMVKETVKAAAVIGREFELPVLSEIMKENEAFAPSNGDTNRVLKEQVKTAEKAQIWQAMNELRYIFRHALLREAVYDMQLKTRLRELHRVIAEAIESLYQNSLEQRYVDLVFHYKEAGVGAKLKHYLLKAADHAREHYQNQQAIDYYDQLLELLEKEGDKTAEKRSGQAEIFIKKGSILEMTGEWEQAEELYKNALALVRKTDNSNLLGETNSHLGYLLMMKGDYEQADAYLETAAAFFGAIHDNRGTSKVYGNLGTLYFRQGKYEDAKLYFIRSIQLAQLYKHTSSNAQIVATLGLTYMNLGKYDDGIRWQQSQLDICKKMNDKQGMATLFVNMGIVYFEKGDFDAALKCNEQGLELCEELGNKQLTAIAIGSIGNVWQRKGNFEMAMQHFQRDLVLVEELGDKQGISIALGLIGELYSIMGEFDKAIEYMQRNLDIGIKLGYRKGVAKALNSLGDIYYFKKDFQTSIDYYDRCIMVTRSIGNKLVLGYSLVEKGTVLLALGEVDKANENLKEPLKLAKELKHPDLLFEAKLLSAKIDLLKNRKTRSAETLEALLAENPSEKDKAALYYEFSKIDKTYTQKALAIYEKLYERTPMHIFKIRIEKLKNRLGE
ncbi:MAG TPA: tetratricopeptide repeat protein [Bacteroidetes bacterium]|nr:tetratricopeptide repeat protein [Bacteroidota bacterium]